MEINCLNHSVCLGKHLGCENICVQHLGKMSAPTLVASMFFTREDLRLKGVLTRYELIDILSEYGIKFKSIDFEMFFTAELQHLRYYPISEFEKLCFKCIDFSNIIQKPTMFDGVELRSIPRGPFPKTYR